MSYGTVENVKRRSGITSDDVNVADATELDSFISDLLDVAASHIERFTQREFNSFEVTKKVDGNGNRELRLPDYPVSEVKSVKEDGDVVDSGNYRLKNIPGHQSINSGILERMDKTKWSDGLANIEVNYIWGFATTPPAVKDVAEEIASEMLKTAANNYKTGGLDSMSVEGFQTKFESQRPLTEEQKSRLKPFKKGVFV